MTADICLVYFLYNCAVLYKYAIIVSAMFGSKLQPGPFKSPKPRNLQLLLAPVRLWFAGHFGILVLRQELLCLKGCHATGA